MPVSVFTDAPEPDDQEAVVWRFMDMDKFRDLVTTSELYLCRADLFKDDEKEGLPPESYFPKTGMNRLDIHDAVEMSNHVGSLAQFRQGFFMSCWCLLAKETAAMWKKFAKEGVAISSRYSWLKAALNAFEDDALIGKIRYGLNHLTGWNVHRFITTKREEFSHEREIRAAIWVRDERDGMNRHIGESNFPHDRPIIEAPGPRYLRRRIDLKTLVNEIIVSPYADETRLSEVEKLIRDTNYLIPARPSELTRFKMLLP
jgi:hypothetical protein